MRVSFHGDGQQASDNGRIGDYREFPFNKGTYTGLTQRQECLGNYLESHYWLVA